MSITSEIAVKGPQFAAAVAWVAKWAPGKPVVPIQGGIQIDEVGGEVMLTAYSENVTARAGVRTVGVPDRAGSRAVVSARLLNEVAATMKDGDVVIGPGADGTVQLRQGRAIMTLPAMAEDEFPALPSVLRPIGEVPGDAFAAAVKRVAYAAGEPDESPVALACMRLGFTDDTLEVMGVTREHAAMVTLPWTFDPDRAAGGDYTGSGDYPAEATPLAAMMAEAAAAFAGPDNVEIGCDGNVLSLANPTRSLTMTTMVVEGGWPAQILRNYAAMQHPHTVTVDRTQAAMPLKQAVIAQGRTPKGKPVPIVVTFAEGEIRLSAKAGDENRSAAGVIDAHGYEGLDMTFGFQPAFIADGLAASASDHVSVAFGEPNKAIILRCSNDPTWLHIVMPMKLPS